MPDCWKLSLIDHSFGLSLIDTLALEKVTISKQSVIVFDIAIRDANSNPIPMRLILLTITKIRTVLIVQDDLNPWSVEQKFSHFRANILLNICGREWELLEKFSAAIVDLIVEQIH